ncbi:hypothetical protein [Ramlibacter alkalitolerans]|uniref:ATP-binding protein n=1 Tax=Ramlibacter alkalitolerans TaxID=2039631 RepID=A0ABS1JUR7_9BURK|nr:hypothetical protein [Ramlibacter alkalitolerans]MBL0427962.1 hypothetical protein [Ramlibacter alkalitolerans]
MLSPISQVGVDATDWFLATHSPITCEDSAGPVEQQDLFEELFAASKPETLVIVKGEHGAGKSQLINWLKLRFDDALAHGEHPGVGKRRLRSVLIRRRSGSLKDALEQLVEQLPEYERYLAKIQAAIAGVSGEAAKRRLYTEMQHCLLATRDATHKKLKALDEVFNANATVAWLCRKGGAIDRNIRRLTEESDVAAREALPPFTDEDFDFPANARFGFDDDLADRLSDDEALRRDAATRATEHLRQAIAGLTGLRGHTLNEIFRQIREEMQRQGEALALFVEDVSTLSVLDEELINALQPLNDPALCPLLSVLGMTVPAFNRLPDNLRGRTDRVLEILPQASLTTSEAGGDATDRFVARYLNGLRVGPQQVHVLGDDVRHYGDQRHSACEECALKSKCFEAFGAVRFGEAEVGLYPLSPGAARRLLSGLTDTKLLTPRTLLQFVVLRLLGGMAKESRSVNLGMSIEPRSPRDLLVEQDRMLIGWTADQKGRIPFLLYYWTGSETLAGGATSLSPMLPWFGHPPFSQGTAPRPSPVRPQAPEPKPRVPLVPEVSSKYTEAINRLQAWFRLERPLEGDSDFRKMLAAVITQSLPLDDVREPSDRIRRASGSIDASNIEIEGMIRKPSVASKARFSFSRSEEIFQLLTDLSAFEHLGRKSWRFPGGEDARRRYGTWLANNADKLIRSFDFSSSKPADAIRVGIRFLHLAYRFSNRKDLPPDKAGAVEAIVSFKPTPALTLTASTQELAASLPQRVQEIRDFIVEEQAVRQGTGGINFIDPRPFIEHLSAPPEDLSLGEIDAAKTVTDYPAIGRLIASKWAKLDEVLGEEQRALYRLTYSLEPLLRAWGLSTGSIPDALREYLEGARAVIKACEAAGQSLGDSGLQNQIRDLAPAVVSRYVLAIEDAIKVLEAEPVSVLNLDIASVKDTVDFVSRADNAIQRLQQTLAERLSEVLTEEEVEMDRNNALSAIDELVALGSEESGAAGAKV